MFSLRLIPCSPQQQYKNALEIYLENSLPGCNQTMRSPQRRTHCQENEIPGQSNATRQCAQPSAAYTLPRKRNPWAIECNKTTRMPQRRTHCQENEMLGQSNATGQCAALSGVHIAKKPESLGNRMQQEQ